MSMYCRPDGVERRSFFSRSATHAESHMTCVGWMSHAWDMSWTHAGVGWMSHAWGDMTWRRTLGGLVGVPPCLSAMDHTGPVLVKRAAPKTARVFDNTSRRSGGGGGLPALLLPSAWPGIAAAGLQVMCMCGGW